MTPPTLPPTQRRILAHFAATGNRPRWQIDLLREMGIKSTRLGVFNDALGLLIGAGLLERVYGEPVTVLRLTEAGAGMAAGLGVRNGK